ncbi:MAG: BrnT family toxin [Gemmatimonadota bacterium]
MAYRFELDAANAAANIRKHGESFEEAATVFGDPLAINLADPEHSEAEERYLVLGMSQQQHLLVVAYAERGERTRIISARKATRRERNGYEKE